MQKVKLKGKLSLGKETIARLNSDEMKQIVGGSGTFSGTCSTCATMWATCWGFGTTLCQPTCFRYEGTLSCCE